MNEPELIVVLGGARAGKSRFALRLAAEREAQGRTPVCFLATAEALDDEMQARIERHRAERPPDWLCVEEPIHIDNALERTTGASTVILDCLTLWVSNCLMSIDDQAACSEFISEKVERFLAIHQSSGQTIICVSNEVGLGLVPDTSVGRIYRDLLGNVNQRLAQAATDVYLVVAGLPIRIKN
jgi:adenosylcobinamide kinase/adenosylcobinamide-phosphate guanylyltransferase